MRVKGEGVTVYGKGEAERTREEGKGRKTTTREGKDYFENKTGDEQLLETTLHLQEVCCELLIEEFGKCCQFW
ncbi:hypothetical protein SUGI_0574330 [Cryptomeria japonica]|nr:hypothetical protein SUGI_0574330 [Cryptomeria japonica]